MVLLIIIVLSFLQPNAVVMLEGSLKYNNIRTGEFIPDYMNNNSAFWYKRGGAVIENESSFHRFWNMVHNQSIDSLGYPMIDLDSYNILFLVLVDVDCTHRLISGVSLSEIDNNPIRVHLREYYTCSDMTSNPKFTYYYHFGSISKYVGAGSSMIELVKYKTFGILMLLIYYLIVPFLVIFTIIRGFRWKRSKMERSTL